MRSPWCWTATSPPRTWPPVRPSTRPKAIFFYWGPGLQQGLEGEFRIFSIKTPEPEINAYEFDEASRHPGTPPDEVVVEPMNEA